MELCVNPHNNLSEHSAKRVNQYITEARFPKRYKGLVPFVQTGIAHGDQECKDCPIESPTVALRSNTMKNSDTKDAEFSYVRCFSNSKMKHSQRMLARGWEKPSQYGNNQAPGLLGAEVVGRKERNQNRYANGWYPVFETRIHIEIFVLRSDCKGAQLVQNQAAISGRGLALSKEYHAGLCFFLTGGL
jgi:hypothetical protein